MYSLVSFLYKNHLKSIIVLINNKLMPPKNSAPKADNPKTVERMLGHFLALACYAHSKDLKFIMGDTPSGTNPLLNEHYDNYSLPKAERKPKLVSRFTVGGRTEQALRMLWESYIGNLRDDIEIRMGDTFDTIRGKLVDVDDTCPAAFVFRVWDNNETIVRRNATLMVAYDGGKLQAESARQFPKIAPMPDIMSIVFGTFDGFLRALAMHVSSANWYGKLPIEPIFWGFLLENGMMPNHILEWRDNMRPEPERKPKGPAIVSEMPSLPEIGAPIDDTNAVVNSLLAQ